MEKKKLKIKLNGAQVVMLVTSFDELKANAAVIQQIINDKTTVAIKGGTLIGDNFIQELKDLSEPILSQLEQYSKGFKTFSRSMARKEKNPDEALKELLGKVRTIQPEAEQLLEVFDWSLKNATQRVTIHNNSLSAQHASDGAVMASAESQPTLVSQVETPAADRSETEGGGQGGEGL